MKKLIISTILLLIIMISCEKENKNNYQIVSKLDITGADYLVLKTSDNAKSTLTNSNLYKITIDGENISEEKVRLLDKLGNEVDPLFSNFIVNYIVELKNNLLCLSGSFEMYIDSSDSELHNFSSLLVRISDGAIYDFNGHFPSKKSYYLNQNKLQTDQFGNVYYESGNIIQTDYFGNVFYESGNIYKLSETENGFTQEEYLSPGEEYWAFFIDLEGNCYYDEFPYSKVKKAKGGIAVSDIYRYTHCLWNTYNEQVMVAVYDSVGILNINDNKLDFSFFSSINCTEAWQYIYNDTNKNTTQIFSPYVVSDYPLAGSIIFAETLEVFDLFINDELFTSNELWVEKISGNYLFYSSAYSLSLDLFKVDLSSYGKVSNVAYILDKYEIIDFPDNLDVKTYDFTDNGEITFSALRLSDEMQVTGIIDTENSIHILSESSDKEYNNLIRLN
jgi:hypothetical protein